MESPNVLLIVLDAVRAKNCSLYDHVNETTPFLEELSDGATVYEQARSPGTDSIISHTSIFTGYAVAEHQTTAHEARIDPESTIWETLRAEHDYATGLFRNEYSSITSAIASTRQASRTTSKSQSFS